MKNKDNLNFISSKFKKENISAPEAISSESIKEKLEQGASVNHMIRLKPNKNRALKKAISLAAAFAVVVVSLAAVDLYSSRDNVIPKTSNADSPFVDGLMYFTSYDEINKCIKDNLGNERRSLRDTVKSGFFSSYKYSAEGTNITEESVNSASAKEYSSTYKQVESVDEADIVKTDGEYIYYVSNLENKINISSAKDGKTKTVSAIKQKGDICPYEIYIKGNRLIVLGTDEKYNKKKKEYEANSVITVYDITDKGNIKLENEYKQSGCYSSSRMIGNCVYIVSSYSNYSYIKNECIPCATGSDGEFKKIAVSDICAIKGADSADYTVIGAFDIESGKRSKRTKAFLGATSDVYCNESNMYVVGAKYNNYRDYYTSDCEIVKISLNKTDIKIAATGSVRGEINNQFSMDEKDGYFRIATTTQTKAGKDINMLYVLNSDLEQVGKVSGFAKNEHIEAVRYVGDMAYVITYKQTDPLFIIDLSSPKKPEILGEVKISGFSTMLVPIDENTLLGIGYSTSMNKYGEATDGVKLALFDISDKSNPKILDEKEFENALSEAQSTHKALAENREKGYFAIPINFYSNEKFGALVFAVKDKKINIRKKFVSNNFSEPERCLYIGNYIYTVDTYSETVDSFLMD